MTENFPSRVLLKKFDRYIEFSKHSYIFLVFVHINYQQNKCTKSTTQRASESLKGTYCERKSHKKWNKIFNVASWNEKKNGSTLHHIIHYYNTRNTVCTILANKSSTYTRAHSLPLPINHTFNHFQKGFSFISTPFMRNEDDENGKTKQHDFQKANAFGQLHIK